MLNVGAGLTTGGYGLLLEAMACCWRLGLTAGGYGLLLEARAHCWRLGLIAGGLPIARLTAGGLHGAAAGAMVSLKALRATGGCTGIVEP